MEGSCLKTLPRPMQVALSEFTIPTKTAANHTISLPCIKNPAQMAACSVQRLIAQLQNWELREESKAGETW